MPLFAMFTFTLDRATFVCGLAMLVAGVAWFALRGRTAARLPWASLGVFGWAEAGSQFAAIAGAHIERVAWDVLHTALLSISLAALVEFGRLGWKRDDRPALPLWIYLPLIALALTGALSRSFEWVDTTCRWALGWPGAALAGSALVRAGSANGKRDRWLLATAVLVSAYVVIGSAALPSLQALLAIALAVVGWVQARKALADVPQWSRACRLHVPLAAAALLLAGWFALSPVARANIAVTVQRDRNHDKPAAAQLAWSPDDEPSTLSKVWRYTLTALPFVIFLLLFWAGSRLPFVDD